MWQSTRFGLRGPEIATLKDHQATRVMVLGGSSVFGYLVPNGQDSCIALEKYLSENESLKHSRFEVLNAGVPGYNMTQCRLRYSTDLASLRPDWVILYLGWNDLPTLISEQPGLINQTPPAPSWIQRCLLHSVCYGLIKHRLLPPDSPQFAPPEDASTNITSAGAKAFRRNLEDLIETVQSSGAKILVSTQLMAGGSDCKGLDHFLGNSSAQITANQKLARWISNTIREVSRDQGVPLADVARRIPCNEKLLGDAIHLTRKGHEAVAFAWSQALSDELQEVNQPDKMSLEKTERSEGKADARSHTTQQSATP